jgi:hypothetical protein
MDMLALLNEANRIPDQVRRHERLRELLTIWCASDPETALRYATTQAPLSERQFAVQTVLEAWAKSDATIVLALSGELTTQFGRERAWRWIAQATSSVAPEATIKALKSLPRGRLQAELFGEAALAWSQQDPYAALAWAKALPPGEAQGRAMSAVFAGWSLVDPRTAAGEAANLPAGRVRQLALEASARHFAAADPVSAILWLQSLPVSREREELWQRMSVLGLSEYFRELEPHRALGEATKLMAIVEDDSRKGVIAGVVSREMSRIDSTLVQAWVLQLPAGDSRNGAIRQLLPALADASPREALTFALENLTGRERNEHLARVAGHWAAFEPEPALQFAHGLPEGEGRQTIMQGLVDALREVDTARAASLISELPAGQQQTQAADRILQSWARTDPPAATAWLGQFPEGEARTRGYFSVARQWALDDYQSAGEWINTQPPSPARDEAIRAFVQSVDGADIALANRWAAAIQDQQKRLQSSERVFGRWLSENPSAAINWMNRGEMDAELRSYLTSLHQRWEQLPENQRTRD